MAEINYSLLETNAGWKKFKIAFITAIVIFFFFEFDFIEIGSSIFFVCFCISVVVAFCFFVNAITISSNYKRFPKTKNILIVLVLTLATPLLHLYRTGFFWGDSIIEAAFIDDRSRTDLELFANKRYILTEGWMFGTEQYLGSYKINGDTIQLSKYPYKNDSIGSIKLLYKVDKLLFQVDTLGQYDTKTYSYFKISKNTK